MKNIRMWKRVTITLALILIILTTCKLSYPQQPIEPERTIQVVHHGHYGSYTLLAVYPPDWLRALIAIGWVATLCLGLAVSGCSADEKNKTTRIA